MHKLFLVFASFCGFTAVAMGAFGAHYLKPRLETNLLEAYQTAVQYQFYHSIALLLLGLMVLQLQPSRWLDTAGVLFIIGITLFSGSLYCLSLSDLRQLGPVNIGLLTPIGGTALMMGWLAMAAGVITQGSLSH